MVNEINVLDYGTHKMLDVFLNSFKSINFFIILFIICYIISKKASKKAFKCNNIIFLVLTIFYIIISFIKAYVLSNLPPHDLRKDLCGLEYSIIQTIVTYHIPIIYTIIIFANTIDEKIKLKKFKTNREEK